MKRKRLEFCLLFLLPLLIPLILSCSFIPGHKFYIIGASIKENGIVGTDKEQIEIEFSNSIDEKSIRDNIKIEKDNGSEISFQHQVLKQRVVLYPEEEWEPFHRFWLVVSGGLTDMRGETLERDFYLPFQSTDGFLPVSGIMILPDISGGVVEDEVPFIKVKFSSNVDKNGVENAFSISPSIKGNFEWSNDILFTYTFSEPLKKNTLYTVSISDDAKDSQGFKIKPFSEDFEYFPNSPYPEVTAIYYDAVKIYDYADPFNSPIDGEKILIKIHEVEKDIVLRFDFSVPVDVISFRKNLNISPHVEWYAKWNLDNTMVNIYFKENLKLDEEYEVQIAKGLKNLDGVEFPFEYRLFLKVNGPYSRFIEFYAPLFTDLDIKVEDVELWKSGTLIQNGVEGLKLSDPSENNGEGYALKVNYNESLIQKQDLPFIEVRCEVFLEFIHPSYIPILDKGRLQDSVSFQQIFGNSSFIGNLDFFSWKTDNTCTLKIREVGHGCIYRLLIEGGKNGVIDELDNYMKEDVEFFFNVVLY